MLNDFRNISLHSSDAGQILASLLVSLVCGLIISIIYRATYRGSNYSASFVRSMIFLAMITALVMLVIGNNLARAFGLVGAMSIIRFRTAVKDTQDIVFIFFSLAVGLAAGVGFYTLAFVGTILIGLVVAITTSSDYGAINRKSYLLQMTYDAPQHNGQVSSYAGILEKYCKKHKLINVKASGDGDGLDLTFYVDLKNSGQGDHMTRELGKIPNVTNINLFFDDDTLN